MRRTFFSCIAMAVGILALYSPALAESAGVHVECTKLQVEMGEHLSVLLADLQAAPVEKWAGPQIEDYLNTSLWYVYSGVMLFQNVERRLPAGMGELVGMDYLPAAPLNPFADWEPMEMRTNDTGFHAGDICLQRCPPEPGNPPRSRSFEISIFGPEPEFAAYGYTEVSRLNRDWAVIPEGAVYQIGAAFNRARGAAE